MAYQTLTIEMFRALVVKTMGFSEVQDDSGRTQEYVFGIDVKGREGLQVRVYSSISKVTMRTRAKGSDAIRVVLFDTEKDRPVYTAKRIMRTGDNILDRVLTRCRDVYRLAVRNQCQCGGTLVPRKVRGQSVESFNGCTNFPECRETSPL